MNELIDPPETQGELNKAIKNVFSSVWTVLTVLWNATQPVRHVVGKWWDGVHGLHVVGFVVATWIIAGTIVLGPAILVYVAIHLCTTMQMVYWMERNDWYTLQREQVKK